MKERQKINTREQQIVAEILTQFTRCGTMAEVALVWEDIFMKYRLCEDPFTHLPCSQKDYCRYKLDFDKQMLAAEQGYTF